MICYTEVMTGTAEIMDVPLAKISAECNDRKHFGAEDLAGLAESIRVHGPAQPITLRPRADLPDHYWIVAGERRVRAHIEIGAETIRAIVTDLDDRAASAAMLIENLQRVDLNPIEEAHAYQARIDRFGLTVEEVAAEAGVAAFRVRWRLDLLRLTPAIAETVGTGQLRPGFARELCRLDVNRQHVAARALTARPDLGHEAFVELCDQLEADQQAHPLFDTDQFLQVADYIVDASPVERRLTRAELEARVEALTVALAAADPTHALLAEAA